MYCIMNPRRTLALKATKMGGFERMHGDFGHNRSSMPKNMIKHEIMYAEIQKDTEAKEFQQIGTVELIKSVSHIFSSDTGK